MAILDLEQNINALSSGQPSSYGIQPIQPAAMPQKRPYYAPPAPQQPVDYTPPGGGYTLPGQTEGMSQSDRRWLRWENKQAGIKPMSPQEQTMNQIKQTVIGAMQQGGQAAPPTGEQYLQQLQQVADGTALPTPMLSNPTGQPSQPNQQPQPGQQPQQGQQPQPKAPTMSPADAKLQRINDLYAKSGTGGQNFRPDGSSYSQPAPGGPAYAQNPLGSTGAGTSPANTAPRPSTTSYGGVQRDGNSFSRESVYKNPLGAPTGGVTYGASQPLSDSSYGLQGFWKGAPSGAGPQSPMQNPPQSVREQVVSSPTPAGQSGH